MTYIKKQDHEDLQAKTTKVVQKPQLLHSEHISRKHHDMYDK
jgi:hypothetical protein